MKPQEIELWAREIVDDVLSGKDVEDSRVELKSAWIDPVKAAERLGGHANASRGENILWIIGINEKKKKLESVNVTEKGDWYKAVEKCFDGFAPRLLNDVNVKTNGNTLVALYFDTATEAPFVVKNSLGGLPQFWVPWREGTNLKAARREDLLKILVPVRQLSTLLSEIKFNKAVAEANFGSLFRDIEFYKALQSGALDTLPEYVKETIVDTYVKIGDTNQRVLGFHQFSGNWAARGSLKGEVVNSLNQTKTQIDELLRLLRNENLM